ncbi:hypothetical protein HZA87_05750 [Candidatus Uhrbacteria bacterium]|nr:hypothetical protein [Candidatus Uhrbacteria bacterium]
MATDNDTWIGRVLRERPNLAAILSFSTLEEYLQPVFEWNPKPHQFPYQQYLFDVLVAEFQRVYGQEMAEGIAEQLKYTFMAETAGHLHLPRRNDTGTQEKTRINAMVLQGQILMAAMRRQCGHRYSVSISSGSVGPCNDNSGGYLQITPRSLIRIVPVSYDEASQFLLPRFDYASWMKNNKEGARAMRQAEQEATPEQRVRLQKVLSIFGKQDRFSDQIVAAHAYLLSCILPPDVTQVTIDMDQFMSSVIAHILRDESSVMHGIFADAQLRSEYIEAQKNVKTAMRDNHMPFNCITTNERGVRSARGKSYEGDMSPAVLVQKLENGEIAPHTLTQYFAYQVECGFCTVGGMNQIQYMSSVRDIAKNMLLKLSKPERITALEGMPIDKASMTPCWGMTKSGRTADYVDFLESGRRLSDEDLEKIVHLSGKRSIELALPHLEMFFQVESGEKTEASVKQTSMEDYVLI